MCTLHNRVMPVYSLLHGVMHSVNVHTVLYAMYVII